jgi:hypothetical protein
MAAGTHYREVAVMDAVVRDKGPAELCTRTAHYWRAWLMQGRRTIPALSVCNCPAERSNGHEEPKTTGMAVGA